MMGSERGARRPETYARLAEEAEASLVRRTPGPWVRWVGWAICALIAAGVLVAALDLGPL